MLINSKNTLFLLCDIQSKFRPHIHKYTSILRIANKLSSASKILSIPLLVTEQNSNGLGHTDTELDINHAHVFQKSSFSMLTLDLRKELLTNHQSRKNIVLFGIEAHVCILQTTLHLIQNQFKVWIVSDGVSSINKQEIAIALDRMKMAGAFITTSDSILFEILGDSMQPEFKDISKLIKEYKLKTSQALMGLSE